MGLAATAACALAQPAPASTAPDSTGAALPAPASRSFWLPRAEEGSPFREDRWQHASLAASLVIAAGSAGMNDGPAAGSVISLGLIKEVLDYKRGTGASRWDLAADVVGVGLGLLVLRATR